MTYKTLDTGFEVTPQQSHTDSGPWNCTTGNGERLGIKAVIHEERRGLYPFPSHHAFGGSNLNGRQKTESTDPQEDVGESGVIYRELHVAERGQVAAREHLMNTHDIPAPQAHSAQAGGSWRWRVERDGQPLWHTASVVGKSLPACPVVLSGGNCLVSSSRPLTLTIAWGNVAGWGSTQSISMKSTWGPYQGVTEAWLKPLEKKTPL
jgi:hypothetical protein